MSKQESRTKGLPTRYPSVPDSESRPSRYNEPNLPAGEDRMPSEEFQFGDTRADLRLRIEQLLQRKEAASVDRWTELGPAARGLLVEMLDDEALRLREAMFQRLISVLGLLTVKRSIAPLSAILADGSTRNVTRAFAANALGRIGDGAALDALVAAATVRDDMIRRQVAMALGRIDREAVIPHLMRLGNDKSIAVAEIASEALERWEENVGQRLGAKRTVAQTKPGQREKPTIKRLPAEEY